MAAGGDTTEKTSIYKVEGPEAGTWVPGPDMGVGRGYQAQTTTADGQVRALTLLASVLEGTLQLENELQATRAGRLCSTAQGVAQLLPGCIDFLIQFHPVWLQVAKTLADADCMTCSATAPVSRCRCLCTVAAGVVASWIEMRRCWTPSLTLWSGVPCPALTRRAC